MRSLLGGLISQLFHKTVLMTGTLSCFTFLLSAIATNHTVSKDHTTYNYNTSEILMTGPHHSASPRRFPSHRLLVSTISAGSQSNDKILLKTYKGFNNLTPLQVHSFSLPQIQLCKAPAYSQIQAPSLRWQGLFLSCSLTFHTKEACVWPRPTTLASLKLYKSHL